MRTLRLRVLVVLLSLLTLSTTNVYAFTPESSDLDEASSIEELLSKLASTPGLDPAKLEFVHHESDPALIRELSQELFSDDTRKPQWIYPPDERFQISPAFTEVAFLYLSFFDQAVEGSCTGAFIGPRVILTAAHCLYDLEYQVWADYAAVVPGKDGAFDPLGHVYTSNFYVPVGFGEGNPDSLDSLIYDIGLVVLDENLGNTAGQLAVGSLLDQTLLDSAFNPFTIGYPGDKPYGTQWGTDAAALVGVTEDFLLNQLDTIHGQSGSPMMRGSDAAVVGVVSSGLVLDGNYIDISRRITPGVLAFFDNVCTDANCSFNYFVETAPPVVPTPPSVPEPPAPPPPANPPASSTAFQNTWARTDQPVSQGQANRTWMWGPTAFSAAIYESYAETPGGQRTVQYFDKSRMEITNPNGDPNSIWYVTNGLLVNELMTGRLQLGDNTFDQHQPAQVNVAGDADDATGPTYATFNAVRGAAPLAEGSVVTQRIDRQGNVMFDPAFAAENVTAARFVPETNHTVASVFWNFMNAEGLVFDNGSNVWAPLFVNPFYATGYPVTEPYWASVKVGGTYRNVLIQVFERRVLTYTPGNGAGWEVEAGNVGQHYYNWRYTQIAN